MMISEDGVTEFEVCDFCHADVIRDCNGRPTRGAVTCLFGVLLCKNCDDAIERKPVKKVDPTHPKMKSYLKKVEGGAKEKAPFKVKFTKPNGVTSTLPFKHTAATLKKCGMNRR